MFTASSSSSLYFCSTLAALIKFVLRFNSQGVIYGIGEDIVTNGALPFNTCATLPSISLFFLVSRSMSVTLLPLENR